MSYNDETIVGETMMSVDGKLNYELYWWDYSKGDNASLSLERELGPKDVGNSYCSIIRDIIGESIHTYIHTWVDAQSWTPLRTL